MSNGDPIPPAWAGQFRWLGQIRWRHGVVGKTSIVAVATLAILAALPGRDILVVSPNAGVRKGDRVAR